MENAEMKENERKENFEDWVKFAEFVECDDGTRTKDKDFNKWVKLAKKRWDGNSVREKDFKEKMDSPGIYAIAYGKPDKTKFDFIEKIVYFGMTNSIGGLKSRLRQFYNTIWKKKSEHGGASRFCFFFNVEKKIKDENWRKKLYVSIWPFQDCDVDKYKNGCIHTKKEDKKVEKTLHRMGEIAKEEYYCFAEYVKKWGHMPPFNDKICSPKKEKKRQSLPISVQYVRQ